MARCNCALTIKPDMPVAMQPVEVAQMTEGTAVLQTGLQPGVPIVLSGQYRLQPGSHEARRSTASGQT